MTPTVLVVDDDGAFRELVADILEGEGYRVLSSASAEEALARLAGTSIDLVVTDQRMPGIDGIELTRRTRAGTGAPAVIVMTAYGTIPEAVEAVRVGASDYLTKPLESPEALRRLVRRVLGERSLEAATESEFLSRDPVVLEVLALADRAAKTDATVLISGESGTGKELLARRIHQESQRRAGPFIGVNCAAIPESLAESELFGHEKGAFTGAESRRTGRFEQASGGTLFLDEVGELSEPVQGKLLRVLEERAVERVGGSRPVPVDIRLVAATNRSLGVEVEAGRFRADLYYRLNVVDLALPPLRERRGDLPVLVPRLIEAVASRLGIEPRPLQGAAMELLAGYGWPGNVRELRNVLERTLITAPGDQIRAVDLPVLSGPSPSIVGEASYESGRIASLEERERQAILEALERTGGHRERAARLLGVSVRTLYNRLNRYGIR
ncbi:MAG: sigma-54 dependent transcriptional regulator [Acidobacteria bacterium]|nr:sigma-54 dependent transcriptional regulator [Acidobacteriota bacterium]